MNKMSMKEFTKQAGVSRQTAYDWLKRGFIVGSRFGKKRVFDQKDLARVPAIRKMLVENQNRI